MKKFALGTAVAAMTLVSGAALAQPYGYYNPGYDSGYYRDSDRDGRPDHREWNRDRDRDGRPDQYDRYDNRRDRYRNNYGSYGSYGHGGWRQGQVYPYYRDGGYVIRDYHTYGLPAPRSGYRYYRSNNGDVVMAAIATGVIAMILSGALNNNNRYDGYRSPYGYGGNGGYGYGYGGYYR